VIEYDGICLPNSRSSGSDDHADQIFVSARSGGFCSRAGGLLGRCPVEAFTVRDISRPLARDYSRGQGHTLTS